METVKHGIDSATPTPREIYECDEFNMFGCVLLFLIWVVINPISYAIRLLSWIFHVGRKD